MIILFVSSLYPDRSNPHRALHNARLVRRLARAHELRVISPRPRFPWRPRPIHQPCPEDVELHASFPSVLHIPGLGALGNHRLYAAGIRPRLSTVVREWQPDLILAAWLFPDACAVSRIASGIRQPVVAIAQGTDTHHYLRFRLRRWVMRRSLNRCTAIVCRSRELHKQLADAGVREPRLCTIYNGVDTQQFRPGNSKEARLQLGLPEHGSIVLYVGNLMPVKNPGLLLSVADRLKNRMPIDRTPLFVFVGNGPLLDTLKHQAEAAGLASRCRFEGVQPPEAVVRFMQAADVLAVPSRNEGVPNVIREAFACAKPVVATRVGGIPEIVTADDLGKLVPLGDCMAFAAALERILNTPPDAKRIRQYALRFTWDRTIHTYTDLFEELVGRRPRPS